MKEPHNLPQISYIIQRLVEKFIFALNVVSISELSLIHYDRNWPMLKTLSCILK